MKLRSIVFAAIVAAALCALPATALAWSNGGEFGYGTHDWVLSQAVRIAGAQGTWLDLDTALPHTSDPDFYDADRHMHSFREHGVSRGGPQAVADYYYAAVVAYRGGDTQTASYDVAMLSHYFSDNCQPFHTAYDALKYGDDGAALGNLHILYEVAVGRKTNRSWTMPEWAVARDAKAVLDVRNTTISAAYFSRARWIPLRDAIVADQGIDLNDSVVTSVTAACLTRACNDLADIIRTIPTGSGLATSPTTITSKLSRTDPTRSNKLCLYTTCRDAKGRGLQGMKVSVTWPTARGEETTIVYTDDVGVARSWHKIGSMTYGVSAVVTATVTNNGKTWVRRRTFTPVPILGRGSKGVKAGVSTTRPLRESTVTASALVRGSGGHAVAGVVVEFRWSSSAGTVTVTGLTDSTGVARITRKLTGLAKVTLRARVRARGGYRTQTLSITPH